MVGHSRGLPCSVIVLGAWTLLILYYSFSKPSASSQESQLRKAAEVETNIERQAQQEMLRRMREESAALEASMARMKEAAVEEEKRAEDALRRQKDAELAVMAAETKRRREVEQRRRELEEEERRSRRRLQEEEERDRKAKVEEVRRKEMEEEMLKKQMEEGPPEIVEPPSMDSDVPPKRARKRGEELAVLAAVYAKELAEKEVDTERAVAARLDPEKVEQEGSVKMELVKRQLIEERMQPQALDSLHVCDGREVEVLVVLLSTEDQYDERNTVRMAWQSHHKKDTKPTGVRVVHHVRRDHIEAQTMVESRFLLLKVEHHINKDVVYDPWLLLTDEEHAVLALSWAREKCSNAPFVLQIASVRSFVNDKQLLRALRQEDVNAKLLIGSYHAGDPGTLKPPWSTAVIFTQQLLHAYFSENAYPSPEKLKRALAKRPRISIMLRKLRKMQGVQAKHMGVFKTNQDVNLETLECTQMSGMYTVTGVDDQMMDHLLHQVEACEL